MNTIRKAIAQFLVGLGTWVTAVTVSEPAAVTSSEWAVLFGGLVGAFLVWLIPNEPATVNIAARLEGVVPDDIPTTGSPERGAVDVHEVLYLTALVLVIICGLKFLGVI